MCTVRIMYKILVKKRPDTPKYKLTCLPLKAQRTGTSALLVHGASV